MKTLSCPTLTGFKRRYIIALMLPRRKIARTDAEKARDTAGIVGSLKHEGYVPTPEAEAVHQRVARGDLSTADALEIFRKRAQALDAKRKARKPRSGRT